MNIFYLDPNPIICARFHYDTHVVKMILESAQLLSTAHHILSGNGGVYKKTHENHPCALWVRESSSNYEWLWKLMSALGDEYTYRFDKTHKTIREYKEILRKPPEDIKALPLTNPPECMPDGCKTGNVVDSYRNYYATEKLNLLKYTKRTTPKWLLNKIDTTNSTLILPVE